MEEGITRAVRTGLLTIAVGVTLQCVCIVFWCSQHQAWIHAHTGQPVIMLTHEYGVPRPGDVVFACESPHHAGPIVLHTDLDCFCAPATTPVGWMTAKLGGGTCTPKDGSASNPLLERACAPAYCDEHWEASTDDRSASR